MKTSSTSDPKFRLFVTCLLIGVLAFSFSCSESGQKQAPQDTTTTDDDKATPTEASNDEGSRDAMSFTEEDIEALKAKFTYDEASGWFSHNLWAGRAPKRRTLYGQVQKTGYYQLCSNYYGSQAVNHTRVIVTVGDEKFTTNSLKKADRTVQKDGDSRYETNCYTNYGDNGLLEAIFNAPGDTEVSIIFDNPDRSSAAVPLPDNDRQALKECWQLSLVRRMEAAQQQ